MTGKNGQVGTYRSTVRHKPFKLADWSRQVPIGQLAVDLRSGDVAGIYDNGGSELPLIERR